MAHIVKKAFRVNALQEIKEKLMGDNKADSPKERKCDNAPSDKTPEGRLPRSGEVVLVGRQRRLLELE